MPHEPLNPWDKVLLALLLLLVLATATGLVWLALQVGHILVDIPHAPELCAGAFVLAMLAIIITDRD